MKFSRFALPVLAGAAIFLSATPAAAPPGAGGPRRARHPIGRLMAAARALRSPAPQPCARTRADAKRGTKARASPIEDMRALLKKVTAPQPAATASVAAKGQAFADTAPSWDAIQSAADAVLEKNNLKAEWDFETGEPSAYAKRRTFPKDGKLAHTDTPHRVSFFRDHASWCPYSQKCWLLLEEKGVSYDLTKINMRCYGDKPASFLRLNPSGTLPAAVIDGKSLTDSSDIVRVLEAVFPEKPMLPPEGTRARALADQLLWLERGVFSAWMRHVTSAWADEENRKGVELALMAVEDALASTAGPYFLGSPAEGAGEDTASPNDDGFSYVDIAFAPFLERLAASELYFKGLAIRQPPGPKRGSSRVRRASGPSGRTPPCSRRSSAPAAIHRPRRGRSPCAGPPSGR